MIKDNKKLFLGTLLVLSSFAAMGMESITPTPPNSPEKAYIQFSSQEKFNEWQQRDYEFRSMSERGDFVLPRSKDRTERMEVRRSEREGAVKLQEAIELQKIAEIQKALEQQKTIDESLQKKASKKVAVSQLRKKAVRKVEKVSAYDKATRCVERINAHYDELEIKQEKRDARKNTLHPETLKFPSGKAVKFIRAVKTQDVPVVVWGLQNSELQRHPFVELLKPVYNNSASSMWVPENLLRQASYDEIALTAMELARKGRNKPFMQTCLQEVKDQAVRKQKNLPLYIKS